MKILIAGATGLIGGEVSNLLGKVHSVKTLSRDEFADIKVDLNNFEEIENQSFNNYDIFINCAGVIDEEFKENALKAFQRSTYGFNLLIKKLLESGSIKAIVYFSTAHVYGSFDKIIYDDTPVNPISDYAIAHYAAEQILQRYSIQNKIKTFVIRPNAVYGLPRLNNNFKRWYLIPFSFPIECVNNQTIILKSSGYQNRNFVSTEDLAGYVAAIITNLDLFNYYTIINPIGCNQMSVYEFALKCCDVYQKLTGINCKVTRPKSSENNTIDNSYYKSKHQFYSSKYHVVDFLQSFIKKIIEDLHNNIKYR